MWWKLSGLAALEIALIAFLFRPIQTHAVLIDPAAFSDVAERERQNAWQIIEAEADVALALAVAVPLFAYWVVRGAKR